MPISNDSEKREKQIANLKPFRKAETLTPEERERQREIVTKGAMVRTEKQREKRTMKEQALIMLNTEINREQAKKWIGDKADLIADKDLTIQAVMNIALLDSIFEGNAKAYEVLRDTSGQKPKDDLNITADVITAADRALIENINARLNAVDP